MNAALLDLLVFSLRASVVVAAVALAAAGATWLLRHHRARWRVRVLRAALGAVGVAAVISWPGWQEDPPLRVEEEWRLHEDGRVERSRWSNGRALPAGPVRTVAAGLLAGWSLGGILLVGGWWRVRRLRIAAHPVGEDCLESTKARSPIAAGVFRPVVILPAGADRQPDHEWILAHERAHVAHADPRWLFVAALARVLFFFHPAVHWLARRLEFEQERAADESVVDGGVDRRAYARALLDRAACRTSRRGMPAVAGASASGLEGRIRWLLRSTSPATRGWPVAASLALIAAALGLLLLRPPVVGIDGPPAQSAVEESVLRHP